MHRHGWATPSPSTDSVPPGTPLDRFSALWIWRRHQVLKSEETDLRADAVRAVGTALAIAVVIGALQWIVQGRFPGVTWFIVRTLVIVPMLMVWWAVVGRSRTAATVGGLVIGVVLTAYSHYLGPAGLPNGDLRIIAQDPPPTTVTWLSYRAELLVIFPITVVVAIAALQVAVHWRRQRWEPLSLGAVDLTAMAAAAAVIAATGLFAAANTGTADERATVTSEGRPTVETGPIYSGDLTEADGELRITAESRNTSRTPLPPRDRVSWSTRSARSTRTISSSLRA